MPQNILWGNRKAKLQKINPKTEAFVCHLSGWGIRGETAQTMIFDLFSTLNKKDCLIPAEPTMKNSKALAI